MEIQVSPGRRVAVAALALCTALALAVSIGPGTAGAGVAKSEGHAIAAKKKKPKKKKKKKKKRGATPAPVIPTTPVRPATPAPPPPQILRATVTWNNAADLDLVVWAPDGTVGFSFDNQIPSSAFSADDVDGFGPELFYDQLSPSTRQFTYGVCVADDAGLDGTIATFQYTRADGSTGNPSTPAGVLDDPGDGYVYVPPGGYNPSGDPSPC